MSIAKEAKIENRGICPVCSVEDDLIHHYSPLGQDICDECYTKLKQKPLPLDEYDLQPDEMTIEQFADKAGVGVRAVQKWLTANLINYELLTRRNPKDGAVREIRIFKSDDVDNFLEERKQGKQRYKIDRVTKEELENTSENSLVPENSQMVNFMNNFMQMMAQSNKLFSAAATEETKPFLNIKEASDFTQMSENCLRTLIKNGILGRFTGKHGEVLISRKQLLDL